MFHLQSSELENFVAVIGAVACIPLAFTFPAFFHSCALARKEQADTIGGKAEEGLLVPLKGGSVDDTLEAGWCVGPYLNRVIVVYGMVASCIALVGALGNWAGYPVRFPVINL